MSPSSIANSARLDPQDAFTAHGRMVFNVCHRILGSAAEAEDATQVTFMLFLKKFGKSLPPNSAGWLYNTAVFVSRENRRSRARRALHEKEAGDMRPATDEAPRAAWNEVAPHLDNALASLPKKYREPVVMVYLQGQDQQKASEALGIPHGTLRWRLSHGLEQLREKLQRYRRGISAALLLALMTRFGAEAEASESCGECIRRLRPDSSSALPASSQSLLNECMRAQLRSNWYAGIAAACLVLGLLSAAMWSSGASSWLKGATTSVPAASATSAGSGTLPQQPAGRKSSVLPGEAATPTVTGQPAVADGAAAGRGIPDFPEGEPKHEPDQVSAPEGGTVLLYSRAARGDYALSTYALHLGLRNDDRRVRNEVNLIFGNVRRPNDRADEEPRTAFAFHGAAGHDGGSMDGTPPRDEFRVMTRSARNQILDLGKTDYAAVRSVPAAIHDAAHRAVVQPDHVYVLKITEPSRKPDPDEPFYVKLKVVRHRENDAVIFTWQPLDAATPVEPAKENF